MKRSTCPVRAVVCVLFSLVPIRALRAGDTVPATLDLVRHAGLAFHALNGTVDERGEFLFGCSIVPPKLWHDAYSFAACGPKYIESLAMMSLMTGADLRKPPARKSIDYVVSCFGDDGLFYCKIGPDRPWDTSSPEDWANLYGQGRLLRAMLAMHQLDGDPVWVARMEKLVGTLKRIAIRKRDPETGTVYAYYPTTPGYGDIFSYPRSGWKVTELTRTVDRHRVGQSVADVPDHSFGIPLYLGGMIEPLTRYATTFGDAEALALAGELVRFVMKRESAWMPDGHPQGVIPEQNAQYYGHFHAHTLALRGILEYAIATNDPRLKAFVRAGYAYSRTFGIPRLGWFQEYTGKASHETCGLVNMIALAIKMSRSGIGDYWEDVDCYARNHLAHAHFTDISVFVDANHGRLDAAQMAVLRRIVGTFAGWGSPNALATDRIMNCCTANGAQALYYVWDSIVRNERDTVQVNLLLNRRSAWVDIESSLPYAGRVVLRNKTAELLAVRIPNWVKRSRVEVRVGGCPVAPPYVRNYLLLNRPGRGAVVEIRFPVAETVERYGVDSFEYRGRKYLGRTDYTIRFRGNSAIDIEPKSNDGCPTYDAEDFQGQEVPHTAARDYVAATRIRW